jgi:hypothetical protein
VSRLATPQILPGITMPEITLTQTEGEIQADILAALRHLGVMAWRNPIGQGRFGSRSRHSAGLPDIGGILMGGRALLIEVKRPKAKPRSNEVKQNEHLQRARDMGALVIVARSVQDVLTELGY